MKETEVSQGVVIQQVQQAPSTILPAQSVFLYNLAPEVIDELSPPNLAHYEYWDAVVGSGAQVIAGTAGYTSLNAAIAAVAAGDTILLLHGTITENIILNKEIFLQGQGRESIINGTVEFQSTSNYSTFQNLKFGNNLTLDSGTLGIFIKACFQANGFTIMDLGTNPTPEVWQEP